MTFATFSGDGARVAVATEERIVHVCETARNDIASLDVTTAHGQDDFVRFAAFSSDGTRLVTVSRRDPTVRVWDIASGRQIAALELPSAASLVVFSPDGTRLVTSYQYTMHIWDIASGRGLAALERPSPVVSVAFSPDGTRLVSASENEAHVLDAGSGREIAVLQGHEERIRKVHFSPDGTRIVTVSLDNTVRIWEAASGRELTTFEHPSQVLSVSPDGARVITGAGNEAHVFDAGSGREIAVLKGHEGDVRDASFSHDGARILTVSDSVHVWDAASGHEIAVLKDNVESAAFSSDGQHIFTEGSDAVIWTKVAAASLPKDFAGLWFGNFGPADEPPEITRERCVGRPIKINGNGLIVFFEVGSTDPPQPTLHMRCASDLTCQIFSGGPGQEGDVELQGTGNLTISGNGGDLCLAGECHPIARCPALVWTEEERKSGFAERWETGVGAPWR